MPLVHFGDIGGPRLGQTAIPIAVGKVLAQRFRGMGIVAPQYAMRVSHEGTVDAGIRLYHRPQARPHLLFSPRRVCLTEFHGLEHVWQGSEGPGEGDAVVEVSAAPSARSVACR